MTSRGESWQRAGFSAVAMGPSMIMSDEQPKVEQPVTEDSVPAEAAPAANGPVPAIDAAVVQEPESANEAAAVPAEGSGEASGVEAVKEEAPAEAPAPPRKRRAGAKTASEPASVPTEPAAAVDAAAPGEAPAVPASRKHWYVVKVQSGREESIRSAIERRVKIEGLEEYFGEIYIPVENVTEMRNNKRVVRERKLFPGYLMVEVEYNDRILYLFRETSGVGDFVGGSLTHPPSPMSVDEVNRMKLKQGEKVTAKPGKPKVDRGDRVKVKEGMFAGMEGEVKDILEAKGVVRVELPIFGRPVSVELEYWQVDPA